jgi:hypothetical protein
MPAKPEDQWTPESDRRQLERTTAKFLTLLKLERNAASFLKADDDDS